jgi:hypothetical protein
MTTPTTDDEVRRLRERVAELEQALHYALAKTESRLPKDGYAWAYGYLESAVREAVAPHPALPPSEKET